MENALRYPHLAYTLFSETHRFLLLPELLLQCVPDVVQFLLVPIQDSSQITNSARVYYKHTLMIDFKPHNPPLMGTIYDRTVG